MSATQTALTHVVLPGSERHARPGSKVTRACDPQEACDITVKVRRKADLPEPDPARPISKAELSANFGADPVDIEAVEKVLSSFGMKVKAKSEATHSVEFVGPVSAMEAAFRTKLSWVTHQDREYRGRVGHLQVPAKLEGIVTGVFGLDTRPMVKHHRHDPAAATRALPPADSRPWYIPQELAKAYRFPDGDGAGQSIAILEFGGKFLPADLRSFLDLVGLPGADPRVTVRKIRPLPIPDQDDPNAIGEVMLDIEVVAALCPKAEIVVLFSQFTEDGWIANLDAILADATSPTIVSVSYGLAEGTDIWTQDAIDQINDTLKALANAGVTVCVSSGDDGSDDQVGDGQAHLDFPAASPFVLAVGGTSLDKKTGDEIVWFEGDGIRQDGGGAGGGGVSAFSARPSWQRDIAISSVNRGDPDGRIVPDVAANAAGGTGYIIFAPDPNNPPSSGPMVVGGTSASTPLFASLLVRIQQAGKTVGFLPPKLYAPGPKTGGKPLGAVAFRDITNGSNASGSAHGYDARPGFDAVTGWGSPIGQELLDRLP